MGLGQKLPNQEKMKNHSQRTLISIIKTFAKISIHLFEILKKIKYSKSHLNFPKSRHFGQKGSALQNCLKNRRVLFKMPLN